MLVIILTGLYTVLGGMRAVAYNDAIQTIVLITGFATLTVHCSLETGPRQPDRRLGAGVRDLQTAGHAESLELAGSPRRGGHVGARVGEEGLAGHVVRQAWYFNDHFPWLGMAICSGDWPMVLVYRPVHRSVGFGRAERKDGPAGQHLCRLFEALSGLPVHYYRTDLLRAGPYWNKSGEPLTDSTAQKSELMKIQQIDKPMPLCRRLPRTCYNARSR